MADKIEIQREHDDNISRLTIYDLISDNPIVRVSCYDPNLHWMDGHKIGDFSQERFTKKQLIQFAKEILTKFKDYVE